MTVEAEGNPFSREWEVKCPGLFPAVCPCFYVARTLMFNVARCVTAWAARSPQRPAVR